MITPTPNNKGSIYILALSLAVVLTALVLGVSYQLLQFRRAARSNVAADQACVYAELGLRHALHFTRAAPNWRSVLENGNWLEGITVDQAAYSVDGIDLLDGDLADNPQNPVFLSCTATVGDLSRTVQVQAQNPPSYLLRYALAAGGNISVNNHVRINGDVTSNGNFSKTGADTRVFGNVQAGGTIHETTNISGSIFPHSASKSFPDNQSILNYYSSRATPIPYQGRIEKILLSPTSNPYGPVNADGLYMINCANNKIELQNCRIVGTLVLIDPKSDSVIQAGLNWQPARPDYPALITNGLVTIKPSKNLSEHALGNVDLSLPGESGYGTTTDIFPNRIQGLIYSSATLTLDQDCTIDGTVMAAGDLILKDYASCNSNPDILLNPPQCFQETWLMPVAGTWQRIIP